MDKRGDNVEQEHDARCGGYGGWWAQVLDGGAVGWATPPEATKDGIGYAMCACMAASGRTGELP